MFKAFLKAAVGVNGLEQEHKAVTTSFWKEYILKVPVVELAKQIRHCKCKQTKTNWPKQQQVNISLAFDKEWGTLEKAVIRAIELQGAQRKYGAAPRGPLEREASKLWEEFS